MKRSLLFGILGTACGTVAWSQAPTTTAPPQNPSQTTTQTRPDASYPNPSGQDSQPGKTQPKRASGSAPNKGTVESRGSKTAAQAAPVQPVAKQKAYTGNSGKKRDPGTACSTARPTPRGGVDCGTSGAGATPGKVPK